MGPIDFRKATKELKKRCRSNDINLWIEPERGKGSHKGLNFEEIGTGDHITLVVPGKSLSAGVQRSCFERLREYGKSSSLARKAARVWEDTFFNR